MLESTRKLLVGLAVLAMLGAAWGTRGSRTAIARVRAEASRLASQRDSLITVVREGERRQAGLTARREAQEAEAGRLRDSVSALEQRRAAEQLTVRQLSTTGALQTRLRTAFPELGPTGWGVTTLPFEGGDALGLEYLLVPAWFAETFVIDHANANVVAGTKGPVAGGGLARAGGDGAPGLRHSARRRYGPGVRQRLPGCV